MSPLLTRRQFLASVTAGSTVAIAGCAIPSASGVRGDRESNAFEQLPETVGLEPVATGLNAPLAAQFVPDTDRVYVAERGGRVVVIESGEVLDEPLLDLTETVVTGGERGLLGLVVHPAFPENRRLFVHYSAPSRPGTPEDFDHTGVIAEFEASEDGRRVDPDTEHTILEIPQPADFHNGGDLAFGPEGYFYVPVGAGGGGGGGGQDVTEDFLGSVLRIDVDDRPTGEPYAVPEDNPLVGHEGLDEYYAWGFRNPWRLSFDGEDCFVADVGEGDYEEVNLLERGGNYGWNVKEGTECFREDDCPDEAAADATPRDVRGGEPLLDPVVEYSHEAEEGALSGVAVIGGYVYRGSALPALDGVYVFGDFQAAGRLFAAVRPDDGERAGEQERTGDRVDAEELAGLWPTAVVDVERPELIDQILAFGRDDDGEVYVLGIGDGGGVLARIVPAEG